MYEYEKKMKAIYLIAETLNEESVKEIIKTLTQKLNDEKSIQSTLTQKLNDEKSIQSTG